MITVIKASTGNLVDHFNTLKHGGAVLSPSAEVIHLAAPWIVIKRIEGCDNIGAMDLIAHLLALVAEDRVRLRGLCDFHEVGKKTVELDRTVVGAGEAPAAKHPDLHIEVPTILLCHNIGSRLRCPEETVQ